MGYLDPKKFSILRKTQKLIFQKKCQKYFFFQVKSFFLENHQKLHILAKSDVSRLSFKHVIKYTLPNTSYKKFKNNTNRLNLSRAFDWCMNCHILTRKNFGPLFDVRGDPYHKKVKKNILFGIDNSYTNRRPLTNLVDSCCF